MNTSKSAVYFRPWVGENYESGGMFSKRILVLGESHYQLDEKIPLEKDLTIRCVEQQAMEQISDEGKSPLKPQKKLPFWTKIAIAFLNPPSDAVPSLSEKRKFWQSVIFYNFIQESVGLKEPNEPSPRPTKEMAKRSIPAFEEVLREHCPQFIAVFGCELWWKMLETWDEKGPVIADIPDNQSGETELYAHPKGKALAFRLRHPSAPQGFNGREWHPSLMKALSHAPNA